MRKQRKEEKVQRNFRVTIPAEFREKLGLREGDTVVVERKGAQMVVRAKWLVENPTERLRIGSPQRMITDPHELEEKIREGRLQREG